MTFGLVVGSSLSWEERERLRAAHQRWSALLPGIKAASSMAVALFPTASSGPPPPPPLEFGRYNPSGDADWRLLLDRTNIIVNCLVYTRWPEVWSLARQLFSDVVAVLNTPERRITALVLEYTNLYEQVDKADVYDVESLLNANCPHLPRTALSHGPVWHAHHGWFTTQGAPPGSRFLQRMHLSGVQNERAENMVKMESLVRLDITDINAQPRATSESIEASVDDLFASLHDRSKSLLAGYLTAEMSDRISLYAP